MDKNLHSYNLNSREFFLKYSRQPYSFGLEPISHSHYYLARNGREPLHIRSMLSTHEIALLYAAAKHAWNGEAIVDLGPLLGASSWAFARGLSERADWPRHPVIHSFDLWRSVDSYTGYLAEIPKGGAGSVLGHWMRAIEPYVDLFEPHQGDLLEWAWDGRPIGILFVDIAKSWALHKHVVRTMFPHLTPGAILVQQDYIHWNEYWIHIEMARLRKYFRHCQFLRGATSFYECIEPVPAALCQIPADELSYDEQIALLEEERALAPISIQQVMKCAAAKHATEHGDFGRAHLLLNEVITEPVTDNPLHEVSGIAKSNLAAARAFLALHQGQDTSTPAPQPQKA